MIFSANPQQWRQAFPCFFRFAPLTLRVVPCLHIRLTLRLCAIAWVFTFFHPSTSAQSAQLCSVLNGFENFADSIMVSDLKHHQLPIPRIRLKKQSQSQARTTFKKISTKFSDASTPVGMRGTPGIQK